MHCRALGHLTLPSTAAISSWATSRVPPITPTPQILGTRAWLRRISPHSKASHNPGNLLNMSFYRLNRNGGPNLSCDFSSDMPVKRDFTTRSLESVLHSEALEKQSERKPDMSLCPASGYAVYSAAGPHTTDESLSNTSEASHKDLSPGNDVHGANMQPVDPSEAIDEYHHLQAQDTDTQQASATTTFPPNKLEFSVQAPISSHFPKPTSLQTLYGNLCYALELKLPPPLPALVDYHDSFPKYRSAKSYNLLIDIAIRHSQFGTARWLLDAMIHDQIPRNAKTNRLAARWLVRTGKWDTAWARVTGFTTDEVLDKLSQNISPPYTIHVPCELWMELLGTVKRGAIRRPRNVRWGVDDDGNRVHLPKLEVVEEPTPGTEAYSRKRQLLACLRPELRPNQNASPQLIKTAVEMALRDGQRAVAVALTETLLSKLPLLPQEGVIAQCMEIIHALMAADIKNGLRSYYANRKLLFSLLKMHTHLAPTPTTVQLSLTPLKKAKKCGTIAIAAVKNFQEDWGEGIVTDMVRRRVVQLAEKEGRFDIVEEMANHKNG